MPPRRVGGVLSVSVNRWSVVSPGVKTPYQCSGSVSHQTSFFNFPENVRSQINPFPSRKYECPFVTDENGRGGRSTQNKGMIAISKEIWEFALSKGIMITAEYLPGRLGFQKFPRLKRMATISKSIPKNLCKVRIPRAGSFCIRSMPSDTILPVVESRSTQPSNRCMLFLLLQ